MVVNVFSRFLNSFHGLSKLSFMNRSTDKGFMTPPVSRKNSDKSLLSKSMNISFEGNPSILPSLFGIHVDLSFAEYQILSTLLFHWADSYDSKDWTRLSKILAPELNIDYSLVTGKCFPKLDAASFIAMISSPGFLGDPLLKTQHLLGACEYERIGEKEIMAKQQLRAGHLRYAHF